jgi:protease-4
MLKKIEKNNDISAVVIRLNSPGGSAIAAETIFRAVENLKKSGKPVIVSMADVAASGGYYIAAPATKILALPSTLTGSIGVIVGKVSTGKLSADYGVTWDEVVAGQNAAMFGSGRGFNANERAAIVQSADAVYATFKSRVAVTRQLSADAVEALAQGQVWTGTEAKEMGLVDDMGGLVVAIAAARTALGLAPDAVVNILPYPEEDNPLLFLQLLLKQMGVMGSTQYMSNFLQKFSTLIQPKILAMPPVNLNY